MHILEACKHLPLTDSKSRKMTLRSDVSRESVARDRSSHRLNMMVRAIVATVARDLGLDSSLAKLKTEELGESEMRV